MSQFALKSIDLVDLVPVLLKLDFHLRDVALGQLFRLLVDIAPIIAV